MYDEKFVVLEFRSNSDTQDQTTSRPRAILGLYIYKYIKAQDNHDNEYSPSLLSPLVSSPVIVDLPYRQEAPPAEHIAMMRMFRNVLHL